MLHLSRAITPVAKGQHGLFDVPKEPRALERGSSCLVDFSDNFAFFRPAPERLDLLRALGCACALMLEKSMASALPWP